jgi:hypothetical protein
VKNGKNRLAILTIFRLHRTDVNVENFSNIAIYH